VAKNSNAIASQRVTMTDFAFMIAPSTAAPRPSLLLPWLFSQTVHFFPVNDLDSLKANTSNLLSQLSPLSGTRRNGSTRRRRRHPPDPCPVGGSRARASERAGNRLGEIAIAVASAADRNALLNPERFSLYVALIDSVISIIWRW
jgi:hypothetical protein